MRLIYLPNSLEISRESFHCDEMAMWNIKGAYHPAFPDGTTVTLPTIRAIKKLGLNQAGVNRLNGIL